MNTNEFDELLKQKAEQHEFAYKRASWQQLSQQLPPAIPRPPVKVILLRVTGIAAAVAVMFGAVALWYSSNNGNTLNTEIAATPIISNSIQKTANKSSVIKPVTPNNTINNKQITPSNNYSNNRNLIASGNIITPNSNIITPSSRENIAENNIAIKDTEENISVPDKDFTAQKNPNVSILNSDIVFEPKNKPAGKTFFSLTGGVNYGSLNAGYMAGINAKQKLGKKLFVEGDLTVMSNTSDQTMTQAQFTQIQNTGGSLKDEHIVYQNASFVYLQFNPTVGYQLLKNISVGVGADLQRLLGNDNVLVNVDDEIKTIPGLDVGITGKTEIALSKKLKAGLLYREGINNFINSSNDYFDRNYLQVQLKFTVFGR